MSADDFAHVMQLRAVNTRGPWLHAMCQVSRQRQRPRAMPSSPTSSPWISYKRINLNMSTTLYKRGLRLPFYTQPALMTRPKRTTTATNWPRAKHQQKSHEKGQAKSSCCCCCWPRKRWQLKSNERRSFHVEH